MPRVLNLNLCISRARPPLVPLLLYFYLHYLLPWCLPSLSGVYLLPWCHHPPGDSAVPGHSIRECYRPGIQLQGVLTFPSLTSALVSSSTWRQCCTWSLHQGVLQARYPATWSSYLPFSNFCPCVIIQSVNYIPTQCYGSKLIPVISDPT